MSRLTLPVVAMLLLCAPAARAQDLPAAEEKAIKAAAARVAPAVVRIDTTGGLEAVGGDKGPSFLKGSGSATGLVVAADGYVITSSFHFAHKPTTISVTIPGRKQPVGATVVATDHTRMLTLLKVDATGLPLPTAFPKKEIVVGQWALALGRTLDPEMDHPPSVSVGIISATNRIWGKAIQTDAKVSPTNYGGPLVSIDGRVFGVLVPMSPRGTGETAGFDWYDSGIGFAVPLEDILARLPAMREGKDQRPGVLGITTKKPTERYQAPVEVATVQPGSAAEKAGIRPDDVVIAIDGRRVANFTELRYALEPKYADDVIAVKVRRGDQELEFKDVKLQGNSEGFVRGFLGVLPLRDDPGPGVPVRFVYPDSPAAKAGLAEGDRILKIGPGGQPPRPMRDIANRDALADLLASLPTGTEVRLEVKRKDGKTETLTLTSGPLPAALPAELPKVSSAGKALEGQPKKDEKPETGFLQRTSPGGERSYWLYVPKNYDPNVSHGLIVTFHGLGGGMDGPRQVKEFEAFCEEAHFIVMGPKSVGPDGWVPSEADGVVQDVKAVTGRYTIDRQRVIAHGVGNGGVMAYHAGLTARDTFRGVAAVGAALGTPPEDNTPGQPLSFFIAAGEKDLALKQIEAGKAALEAKKYPVVFRTFPGTGNDALDEPTARQLRVWMDSLDRL